MYMRERERESIIIYSFSLHRVLPSDITVYNILIQYWLLNDFYSLRVKTVMVEY